ncbi:MAG: phospholipid carrier-dependent glycosyltransferase [Chloroflexi bacterium]|nr:phospholipid carrier-dependent glycosyltransferase [Chloroflexota bacterium]
MTASPPSGRSSATASPTNQPIWLLTALLLLGAGLRITLLTNDRFHADEALFGMLAHLIATGQDPLLANTSLLVDKPPLFFYTLSLGAAMGWYHEFTLRLPSLAAGLLSIALTMRLSHRVWHSRAATGVAGLVMTLSPFSILFGVAVFSDSLLLLWLLAALAAASERRWLLAGVALGCAIATKQAGLLFLPLLLSLGLIQAAQAGENLGQLMSKVAPMALGPLAFMLLMIAWDFARGDAPSFWTAGVAFNDPGRLIRYGELGPRVSGWLFWSRYLLGSNILTGMLLLGAAALALHPRSRVDRRRRSHILLLLSFTLTYMALVSLIAFPLFDRYLLPLTAILALLAGALIAQTERAPAWRATGVALLLVTVRPAAGAALQGDIPIGGDHGALDGIDLIAAYLEDQPVGSVVYHQSLGWHLAFYTFDDYLFTYALADPVDLYENLLVFGDDPIPRFLLLSRFDGQQELLAAVDAAGMEADLQLQTYDRRGQASFWLYRLRPLTSRLSESERIRYARIRHRIPTPL